LKLRQKKYMFKSEEYLNLLIKFFEKTIGLTRNLYKKRFLWK